LDLRNCEATKDGGGIHIDGTRKMIIDGTITGNVAAGSGGGINFVCPEDDLGENDCILELNTDITYNNANEGGGIKYHDVTPKFIGSYIDSNHAELYGNQKASFPTQMV
jgi:hypothetical protein